MWETSLFINTGPLIIAKHSLAKSKRLPT